MRIEKISAEKLNPAEYNPRLELKAGDEEYEKLKRSIVEFGYVEPVIWNKTSGNVVGGHQRLTVLKDMGEKEIDCVVVQLDDMKEKALNIALNKIQGDWDTDKLSALLTELDDNAFDITLTGFDGAEVDELLDTFYSHEAVQDDFNEQEAKEEIKAKGTKTKAGDVWKLGNHRLMCGDPKKAEDFAKLMNGTKAQMAMTNPPFALGNDYEKQGISPWLEEMDKALSNIIRHSSLVCWNLGDMYATGSQFIEPTSVYSVNLFKNLGYRPIWIRIWKKQGKAFGGGNYHLTTNKPTSQYEYISAFASENQPEYNDQEYVWVSAFANHSYKFVKRLNKEERKKWGYAGIWEMPANGEGMPVELPWRCLKMHSDKDGIVLDPFAGNGTTLIACEQLERICYAMEKDPTYVDIIVKRWEEFTGEKAVKL